MKDKFEERIVKKYIHYLITKYMYLYYLTIILKCGYLKFLGILFEKKYAKCKVFPFFSFFFFKVLDSEFKLFCQKFLNWTKHKGELIKFI